MEKYTWKSGAQFPVAAQVAAQTIRDLQRTLGKESITARELLDASRSADAPLHSCFEWDDSVAAEKFRIEQARHIIGGIEVTIIKDDKPSTTTRLFVNVQPVTPKHKGEFVAIDAAISNPTYRQQILRNALLELRSFQNKYRSYEELTGVSKAIDAFADSLK